MSARLPLIAEGSSRPLRLRSAFGHQRRVGSYSSPITGTGSLSGGCSRRRSGLAVDVEAFVADAGVERFDVVVAPRLAGQANAASSAASSSGSGSTSGTTVTPVRT
jgi:hypothetical protein